MVRAEEQDQLRAAVREYVKPRAGKARQQAQQHERRLVDLQAEQQRLVQLAYKDLIDDDVLAAEQARIRSERAQAARWADTATTEVSAVMDALDGALALVSDTLDYASIDLRHRRLFNQATHEQISPILIDGGHGPTIRVRGLRDPFYVEADRFLGKARLEPVGAATGDWGPKARTPTALSHGRSSHETKMAERAGFEPAVR